MELLYGTVPSFRPYFAGIFMAFSIGLKKMVGSSNLGPQNSHFLGPWKKRKVSRVLVGTHIFVHLLVVAIVDNHEKNGSLDG